MSSTAGTLAHALLGVAAEGPRTGYALVKHLQQSIAYTWPARRSKVCELAKLREAGLIREERCRAARRLRLRADRRGTRGGAPLAAQTEPSRTVQDESALRLFFLWLLEPAEAEAYLRGEAERARAILAELEAIASQEDPETPKTRAYRIALELRAPQRPRPGRVGGVGERRSRLVAMSAIEELSQEEVEELLGLSAVGRIGCHAEGATYVVPIIYAYEDGSAYVASVEGRKTRMMRQNPEVCFEVDERSEGGGWRA